MKADKVSYLGIIFCLITLVSLLLPWWSIRANGVKIDADWVVDHLLALNSALLIVGLLLIISAIVTVIGSLKVSPLLITPAILNFAAAFLFYNQMHSAIGSLAYGYFSGTNLIPEGPWGFTKGIVLCILAGLASPTLFILSSYVLRATSTSTVTSRRST